MIGAVEALAESQPAEHEHLTSELCTIAEAATEALTEGDSEGFLQSLDAQRALLADLGVAAQVPIITREVRALASRAAETKSVVIPAGAGGGDVVLYAGFSAPSKALRELAERMEHRPLGAGLHAQGVYLEGAV